MSLDGDVATGRMLVFLYQESMCCAKLASNANMPVLLVLFLKQQPALHLHA
jgi:hypothetical protein